ncbi:RNA methyltransferase [Candidatus Nitronereus thalassa]|uniref:RNA methyltransferase n=1 Tax=Candidatus Nitronereus thalassa TaxID=3020898 RepID=A0ABU3K9R2_9BACT|nr:RNA methyltransferase [Candidatus Nitronereus thalassa]MDT7043033.1 RNA methyltransferase [Candidatus Nitronereus thalassa]
MKMQINSRGNARFKRWLQLLNSRGVHKHQQFLMFGERVVREILHTQPDRCLELIYPVLWANDLSVPETVTHHCLEGPLFKELDVFGTKTPIAVCRTPEIVDWNQKEAPQGLELLCPLGDPKNVGAVVRTCQALGVQKVILLKEAASPFHPASTRSASGAVLNVEFVKGPSIHDLNHDQILTTLVAMDVSGKNLTTYRWPKHVRLLIGEEGEGLPESSAAEKVAIPMTKGTSSLNAAVAAGMAMYAYRVQHKL